MQTSSSEYSLKSKWNSIIYKRNLESNSNYSEHRRPSHCSDQSVSSSTSTNTIDKLLLGISGLFKRRCSNASNGSCQDQLIYEEEEQDTERLDELYQTAMVELSYAEDSQGSRYYPGDVRSAKEAVDSCVEAFVEFLEAPDRQHHDDHHHSNISRKLFLLKSRFDALPSTITD